MGIKLEIFERGNVRWEREGSEKGGNEGV